MTMRDGTVGTAIEEARATQTIWWILRIGAAMCFVGHGAFGVIGKEAWLPFFGLIGIGPEWAWRLMPLVGTVDIAAGIAVLVSPRPVVFLYMAMWALWTAALRPLSGDSVFEMLERAGNYGVPLALLLLAGIPRHPRDWLRVAEPTQGPDAMLRRVLAVTAATLLIGHGALALTGKPLLASHLALVGGSESALRLIGAAELLLAGWIVLQPSTALAMGVVAWKLVSESLFLAAGDPVWEFVERGGSYAAPLALAAMLWRARSAHARPLRRVAALAVALLAAPGAAHAQDHDHEAPGATIPIPDDSSLLRTLRAGGNVLACRHAITVSGNEQPPEPPHPSGERALSSRGREQARAIGAAIRATRIPIGEVLTSPTVRTSESATLAFERATVSRYLFMSPSKDSTRALFTARPAPRSNRVLMTHQGVLYPNLRVARGTIAEGDCIAIRPDDAGGFAILARLGLSDWERLAR